MLKSLFTSILLLAFLNGNSQYILVWQDEFETDGLPNPKKWSFATGGNGFGNEELQYYTKDRTENARVENGKLIITAKKESYLDNDYTSAKLHTQGKGDWKYGKYEIRAKLPTGKGIWPAMWMLPTQSEYGNWPSSGEIDIMELVGYDPDKVHFTVHTETYNHKNGNGRGDNSIIDGTNTDFHTYAMEWTEKDIKFLVDEEVYFTVEREADDTYKEWPFDKPFYLILNIAVGGTWGGSQGIDNNIFPQTMEVDYVRVYKMAESGSQFPINIQDSNGSVHLDPEQSLYERGAEVKVTAIPDEGYEFKSWTGSYSGTNSEATWPMYFPYNVKATFSRIGEMLENSTFFNGTMSWDFYGADVNTHNDTLKIKIPKATTNTWDIQLSQQGISLQEQAIYSFKFKAKASTTRTFYAGIGLNEAPWTAFLGKTVTLSETEQEFEFEFTMPVAEPNGRVFFDLGQFAGDIEFSEISLIKIKDGILGTSNVTDKNQLYIYPNPTNNIIHLNGTKGKVTILNAEGKEVGSSRNTGQIDLKNLPTGVYYIKTESGEVQMVIKK